MNHSAKQRSAVRMCVFCDMLVLLGDCTKLLKLPIWRSNEFASNSASNSPRWLRKYTACLKKHLVIMPYAKCKPTNGLSISRMDGCQLKMKSVLDDLQPEQPKMWQKFDNEGIMHKEFVPPVQTVNGKFYCGVLRRMTENIQRKWPDKWHNNSWALHHDNAPAHVSLIVEVFGFYEGDGHPPPSLITGTRPVFVSYSQRYVEAQGVTFDSSEEIQTELQDVMKTLTRNDFQQCFWSWKSCWDHCINAKGDYCKGDR